MRVCTHVFVETVLATAETQKELDSPPMEGWMGRKWSVHPGGM